MKLILRREHAEDVQKGWFKGESRTSKLSLLAKLELTSEERSLYSRYPIFAGIDIYEYAIKQGREEPDKKHWVMAKDLVDGYRIEFPNPETMVLIEEGLLRGARRFQEIMRRVAKFGQDEIIDLEAA